MKNKEKNLSHVIRSFEDALGFDDQNDLPAYEKFTSTKRQILEDFDSLEKRRIKHRDSRRTDFMLDEEF